jgi:hypothetical protein
MSKVKLRQKLEYLISGESYPPPITDITLIEMDGKGGHHVWGTYSKGEFTPEEKKAYEETEEWQEYVQSRTQRDKLRIHYIIPKDEKENIINHDS